MITVTTTYIRPNAAQPFFFEADATYTPLLIQQMFDNPLIVEQQADRSQDQLMHTIVVKYADQAALDAFLAQMDTLFDKDVYFAARDAYNTHHNHLTTRVVA